MLRIPGKAEIIFRLVRNHNQAIVTGLLAAFSLLLAAGAQPASAQCLVPSDAATYPASPLQYPMTSNRYAVQYKAADTGRIENLFTPASVVDNSIGFQTLPPGFTQNGQSFPTGYTLTGTMNINLTNVVVKLPDGTMVPLTSNNAVSVGRIVTNGEQVNITY